MQNKKWTHLCGIAIAGAVMLGATAAHASQIPFVGTVTLTQDGTSGNGAVNFAFSGMSVNSIPGGDTLNGTQVSINPSGSGFVMSGPITTVGTTSTAAFSTSGGTISIGNATTGMLSGNVNFITISSNSANPGFFGVNIGLSGLTITGGSSALMSSLVGSTQGTGTLSFSFSSGPQSLAELENIGLAGSSFGSPLNDSLQGTVAVPEPASLALLGTGLLGLGFLFKRRLGDGADLSAQV